jgi:hypothetical protein
MAILMTMVQGQYGAMCITQCSASVALCKATRCHHWASAHVLLPRRPHWLSASTTIEYNTQLHLASNYYTCLLAN